jgi:hypothetical protein
MRDRESLIARIRHLRRIAVPVDTRLQAPAANPDPAQIESLELRVAHLERLLEGFQDSVHRESLRVGKRVSDLEAQIQPDVLGAALDKSARERGL